MSFRAGGGRSGGRTDCKPDGLSASWMVECLQAKRGAGVGNGVAGAEVGSGEGPIVGVGAGVGAGVGVGVQTALDF